MDKSIILTNSLTEVEPLHQFVDSVCGEMGIDEMTMSMINLAIEELVVNVINYAYPEGTEGKIGLRAFDEAGVLYFVITDSGVAFDPTAAEDADITLSAEERKIGGLGIHLVRNIMDGMKYERTDGQNILTLNKKIPEGDPFAGLGLDE